MAELQALVSFGPERPQTLGFKNTGLGLMDAGIGDVRAAALALVRFPAVTPRATTAATATDLAILESRAMRPSIGPSVQEVESFTTASDVLTTHRDLC
jgi:hypothetical protein